MDGVAEFKKWRVGISFINLHNNELLIREVDEFIPSISSVLANDDCGICNRYGENGHMTRECRKPS